MEKWTSFERYVSSNKYFESTREVPGSNLGSTNLYSRFLLDFLSPSRWIPRLAL